MIIAEMVDAYFMKNFFGRIRMSEDGAGVEACYFEVMIN